MQPRTLKERKGPYDLATGLKSFAGYLQGSGKSEHTIRNYRWDILHFARYLLSENQPPAGTPRASAPKGATKAAQDPLRRLRLSDLNRADLDGYHAYLRKSGFKTNTRRRRLITVRRFLAFLAGRKKLPEELGRKIPAPHKVERVPFTVDSDALIRAIRALPSETPLERRNRALLWALAETGCAVSEIAKFRFSDVASDALDVQGKAARRLAISTELADALRALAAGKKDGTDWVFRGWNKYRPLPTAITPRGIELLVKSYSEKLKLAPVGDGVLTPRTFRHSAVLRWYRSGVTREEIQKRLGLRTAYAFRVYEPLFKSSAETTSTGGTSPQES